MPVDEFGREIPTPYTGLIGTGSGRPADIAASIRRGGSPSPPRGGGGGGGGGYHIQNRYSHDRSPSGSQGPRFGYNSRNKGRFPPNSSSEEFKSGGKHKSHYLSAPVTSLLPAASSAIGSVSLPGSRYSNVTINTSSNSSEQKKHPSFEYIDEPLACEYVWKTSELAEAAKKAIGLGNNASSENDGKIKGDPVDMAQGDDDKVKSETDDEAILTKLYEEYRKRYCLNYIRAFFNKHLDDSWFRQRFSPSVRKKSIVELEQIRAATESQLFQEAASLIDFLDGIRLGNGVKQNHLNAIATGMQQTPSPFPSPRKPTQQLDGDPHPVACNNVPIHHLFSFQHAKAPLVQRQQNQDPQGLAEMFSALHVVDIPSHATDEHIAIALVDHYNSTILARHEKQVAQQQQSAEKSSDHSAGDDATPNGHNTVPPKKVPTAAVPLTPPTMLRLNDVTIYPAPATLLSDGPPTTILNRQVLAVGPAVAITEIVVSLKLRQDAKILSATTEAVVTGNASGSVTGSTTKRSVPRKGAGISDYSNNPDAYNRLFDLDVECSDPYGRIDYDADGRGGAPTDNQSIPRRKAVVGVCPVHTFFSTPPDVRSSMNNNNINLATANLRKLQQEPQNSNLSSNHPLHPFAAMIVVLSAAVSSKTRIEQDLKSARMIAQALDKKKRIPQGSQLDDIIHQLSLENEPSEEDILDVSIAYLRRVHLLSFYNGCSEAETIGDVMAGKHPSSAVYLRLQNADDYIQNDTGKTVTVKMETTDETSADDHNVIKNDEANGIENSADEAKRQAHEPNKDMLVQRLDDSIARAVEYCRSWLDYSDDQDVPGMLDEETELSAKDIEMAEENVKDKWVEDHCIMDADGRARCSFRFCHKLFKDANFLEKHLLKKHAEFLRAERAKCHDMYMMSAWDACESRPVPPILVDCGSHFGCVPASIIAAAEPDVEDPEPALWQREEENRIRELEMLQKREELRQQHNEMYNAHHKKSEHQKLEYGSHDGGDGHLMQQSRSSRGGGFVDVDDMKEEKVELSFDAIEVDTAESILAAANKKKKKKRRLL